MSAQRGSLLEHCLRAIEEGLTAGAHGLPLIGSGDWNDGMNRLGTGGLAESVWLGWFAHAALSRFAALSERLGHMDEAQAHRERADAYRLALESTAWDGGWYRRAYDDAGQAVGSAQNDEWRLDSVAQSWDGDLERRRKAARRSGHARRPRSTGSVGGRAGAAGGTAL